ncbi:hypothetical protein GO730_20845 [Spirosoma sp. HMF3257]|uniref:Phage major capsid protein n=1 Tax=Spirosoma telluris TaxID=2183553 RepID=A0A327NPR3_9BACT|nr:hypothetical protein [Spirosoma telluris]RAI75996.1 hypothetical protein HMF3257_20770 [Spirosoma telluris]
MPDSLNLTALAASLETYARDNQEHIFLKALVPGVGSGIANSPIVPISEYMTMMQATDEVVLTNLEVGDVAQPGGKNTFNPSQNAVNFKPRKGKVRQAKVDLQFTHTQIIALYKSYMGQVRAKNIDPQTLPFEEYITARVIAKFQENIRVQTLYNGVYNAAGSTPLDINDGLKTQLLAAIVAGDIPAGNVIDTAVITATNCVSETEKVLAGIPDAEFYGGLVCVCSRQYKTNYESDYRTRWGTLPYNQGQLKPNIVGTDIPFIVEPGLAGFGRPIFTPIGNLVYLYDDLSGADTLAVDYQKRTRDIAWVMDAQVGSGIAVAERVWTNDGV